MQTLPRELNRTTEPVENSIDASIGNFEIVKMKPTTNCSSQLGACVTKATTIYHLKKTRKAQISVLFVFSIRSNITRKNFGNVFSNYLNTQFDGITEFKLGMFYFVLNENQSISHRASDSEQKKK